MTEPLPVAVLVQMIQELREELQVSHQRLRIDMTEGFARLAERNDVRQQVATANRERLIVLETAHQIERQSALRRGTVAGGAAGAALLIVWESLKRTFGW